MDGSEVMDVKSVVAPLNFLVPMAEKPVAYNYEPPPGIPVRTGQRITHHLRIRDARPIIDPSICGVRSEVLCWSRRWHYATRRASKKKT
jgi:hypothetical protein